VIETVALTKTYGSRAALNGVDMVVPDGSIYGLVGPNGSGKTTLLRILAGLRRPTSGEIHICAQPGEVAVLPDTPHFDSWLTGREVVSLARRLSDHDGDAARIEAVLRDAGLLDDADRPVGSYSRGMLQRLGIACTMVGSPRLLLLDEPASALDPQGRREVLDMIARLRGTATVLFSSHILADVQEVCDTVGVLDDGRLRFQGPLESLLIGAAIPRYVVRLRPPVEPVAASLRDALWVAAVDVIQPDQLVVEVRSLEDAELKLPEALTATGARVVSYGPEEISLERAFLELTR
jgi:ABC-2 type transport system ATP-binding protein